MASNTTEFEPTNNATFVSAGVTADTHQVTQDTPDGTLVIGSTGIGPKILTTKIDSVIKQATRTAQNTKPDAEATVLLIGSTGNGKSTLGNFLLDPNEKEKKQLFATATDNLPKTLNPLRQEKKFRDIVENFNSVKLAVIDTPGLNEDSVKDFKHMIDLIETVEKERIITACIFVVKFNSKIDMQYKATIRYYAKLLPSLFEKNVFIVMTDYTLDEMSVAQRKKQGINEEQIQTNAMKEIVECAGLSYDNPLTFKLDCLPLTESEKVVSIDVRYHIINYIFSLEPITLTNLTVAKTDHLLAIDNAKISEYEGTITGYKERLQQTNNKAEKALDEVQQCEKEVAELNKQIKSMELELREKDTDELVTTATWSVDSEWKFFQTQEQGYELKSRWPIENIRRWTNGRCELKDEVETTTNTLKGVVHGRFMRGLYANITLETRKSTKFANEIQRLKHDLQNAKEQLPIQQQKLQNCSEQYIDYKQEIQLFEDFIEQKRRLIIELAQSKMSIDEAHNRLQNL